jgi:hypothetical protein
MEKKHLQKQHPSMGIFIFYQEPDAVYWNAVQSFFSFAMGLKKAQILKYSVMDYEPNSGYFDMMTLILDEIHAKGVYTFHSMFIYVDNSHLLETDYHKNDLWYRLFDNYTVHHLLFIYKDVVAYENEMFAFKLTCHETNLQIEQNPINSFMRNRVIVLDDMNLEDFCLLILNSAHHSRKTGLLDFLPQWLEISNADNVLMRTNFIPTNDTWVFQNYKTNMQLDIHSNCVVPIFISQMTIQFLETLYRQLKVCQKKKILKAINKC